MQKRQDWQVDRFHIAFVIITAGWIAIASGLNATLQVERAENARLRTICAVAP